MEYNFSQKMSGLQPSAIREILKATQVPGVISFAAGNPAAESFPLAEIAGITQDIMRTNPVTALQYGISEGYEPLRLTTLEFLGQRGIRSTLAELIITSGGQQGIELATKVLCDEGDVVVCEKPTFVGALNTFRSYNVRLQSVELEEDGMNLAALEDILRTEKKVRFLYIIANFNNPTGLCTSLAKRRAIYALARKYEVLILEDNPYSELRFAGEDIASFKSLDTEQIVLHAGSYSKIIAPGLRVGYLCAPAPIISKAVVAKQASDVHTSGLTQMICERFLNLPEFAGHLTQVREICRQKCLLMLETMAAEFPQDVTWTRPQGGLFIWVTLPDRLDMMDFCRRAAAAKVAVVPGNAFLAVAEERTNAFRLNFSTPTAEERGRGIAILGELLGQGDGSPVLL
jgi:2-aminoadipate transaminase